MASLYSAIPFERYRADRNVDELTYVLLSRLEGQPVELDENGSPEQGLSLWRELIVPRNYPIHWLQRLLASPVLDDELIAIRISFSSANLAMSYS